MVKKYLAYHQFTIMTNLCLILKRNVISFHFSAYHIRDIIKNLDPNKAHGHDMTSIRMLKLCGYSIQKSLKITFINYLKEDVFPDKWKKVYSMLYPEADARKGADGGKGGAAEALLNNQHYLLLILLLLLQLLRLYSIIDDIVQNGAPSLYSQHRPFIQFEIFNP